MEQDKTDETEKDGDERKISAEGLQIILDVEDMVHKLETDAEDFPECKLKDLATYWELRDALMSYKRDMYSAVKRTYSVKKEE